MDRETTLYVIAVISFLLQALQTWKAFSKPAPPGSTMTSQPDVLLTRRQIFGLSVVPFAVMAICFWMMFHSGTPLKRIPIERQQLVENKRFENEQVDIDGKNFHRCLFINSTLVVHGTATYSLQDSSFVGLVKIRFTSRESGSAAFLVLQMLNTGGMIANGNLGFRDNELGGGDVTIYALSPEQRNKEPGSKDPVPKQ